MVLVYLEFNSLSARTKKSTKRKTNFVRQKSHTKRGTQKGKNLGRQDADRRADHFEVGLSLIG